MCAVFVLDTGFHVFVWVGKEATSHEKGGGLVIAHVSLLNIGVYEDQSYISLLLAGICEE